MNLQMMIDGDLPIIGKNEVCCGCMWMFVDVCG